MKTENAASQARSPGFTPYVPDAKKLPEFTVQAILLGFILSVIFNAANAYLGLKIGLTVSASIPSAVISMGTFRLLLPKLLGRNGTILENNIVHAFASKGETLAAAVIFTVPALFFLGEKVTNTNVFLLGIAGGTLGALMMVPLRQSLMVKEHATLPFPEGTACADVLIAGDKGGASAKPVFLGILFGSVYKFAMSGFNLFKDTLMWSWPSLNMAGFGYEMSPLLAGVGFLLGLELTAIFFAGGLLGYWVIIPMIHAVGGHNIIFPGTIPIDQMTTAEIRAQYVKYMGAGGVAFGGLWSLAKSFPDIAESFRSSFGALQESRSSSGKAGEKPQRDWESRPILIGSIVLGFFVGLLAGDASWRVGPAEWSEGARLLAGIGRHLLNGALGSAIGAILFNVVTTYSSATSGRQPRSEHDLPLPVVGLGILAIFLFIWLVPTFGINFWEALCVILFSFFFVAVSSRMVGLIGTTNQPVSGMTITALLLLTLLFTLFGHDASTIKTAAIMAGAIVCISISVSGDLSQDLKTAALIGATPWKVQSAQIMASFVSAVRSGFILLMLYAAYGFGSPTPAHPHALEAPQSQLMAKLVEGATGGHLPWMLLLTGAGIGLVVEMCGISALAFTIGLYLPLTVWPMMLAGGFLAWLVARKRGGKSGEHETGSLFASGLIAGDALMGLGLAILTVLGIDQKIVLRNPDAGNPWFEGILSTALYAGIVFLLYRFAMSKPKDKHA